MSKPYQESIEKAKRLLKMGRGTVARIGGNTFMPASGYLVTNIVPSLSFDYVSATEKAFYYVARWIDELPDGVPFIHIRTEGTKIVIDACTHHARLWDAEVASLTRNHALIYDCANDSYFY